MADDWTDDELEAAVKAYRLMQRKEAELKPYNKRQVYRDLASAHERTWKSFEFRMQNISAVLDELGEPWLPGLKPKANVGALMTPRIVALLQANPLRLPKDEIPEYKHKLPALRAWLIQVAKAKGKVTYGAASLAFGIHRRALPHALSILGHQADNLDEPIITALVVNKRTQRCSIGIENAFGVKDDEAERQRLYKHWAEADGEPPKAQPTDSMEVKAARFVSVEARPDQAVFRSRVFASCGGRCVVSGCNLVEALDAAHRRGRSWRLGHNQAEDGFLLRKDLHALYDSDRLRIAGDGALVLDSEVAATYPDLVGKRIALKPQGTRT